MKRIYNNKTGRFYKHTLSRSGELVWTARGSVSDATQFSDDDAQHCLKQLKLLDPDLKDLIFTNV